MVDHGALLRREHSGSTITGSEDGLDTGKHSRSPQLRLISQNPYALKLHTQILASLKPHLPSTVERWINIRTKWIVAGSGLG